MPLRAHLLGQPLPAPAIANRHGHGALGVGLADDMPIQFGHDFARGQVAHASTSIVMFVFV